MSYISIPSPLGPPTLFEDEGALVALEWGRAPDVGTAETPLLQAARRQLDAYFDGDVQKFTLPLRLTGTPFQRRGWSRLVAIPYGCTATYGALARDLGTGPRALAAACGANRLPIVVPCHRVIAAGGALGGYSGGDGIETKVALLRLEGAIGWQAAIIPEAIGPTAENRR